MRVIVLLLCLVVLDTSAQDKPKFDPYQPFTSVDNYKWYKYEIYEKYNLTSYKYDPIPLNGRVTIYVDRKDSVMFITDSLGLNNEKYLVTKKDYKLDGEYFEAIEQKTDRLKCSVSFYNEGEYHIFECIRPNGTKYRFKSLKWKK
jgi:hypothetical protein